MIQPSKIDDGVYEVWTEPKVRKIGFSFCFRGIVGWYGENGGRVRERESRERRATRRKIVILNGPFERRGIQENGIVRLSSNGHIFGLLESGIANVSKTMLISIQVGIGQRACLIQTPHGNVLWDLVAFLDEKTVEEVGLSNSLAQISWQSH